MCYSLYFCWSHRCSDFLFTHEESIDLRFFLWLVRAALPKETEGGYCQKELPLLLCHGAMFPPKWRLTRRHPSQSWRQGKTIFCVHQLIFAKYFEDEMHYINANNSSLYFCGPFIWRFQSPHHRQALLFYYFKINCASLECWTIIFLTRLDIETVTGNLWSEKKYSPCTQPRSQVKLTQSLDLRKQHSARETLKTLTKQYMGLSLPSLHSFHRAEHIPITQ